MNAFTKSLLGARTLVELKNKTCAALEVELLMEYSLALSFIKFLK